MNVGCTLYLIYRLIDCGLLHSTSTSRAISAVAELLVLLPIALCIVILRSICIIPEHSVICTALYDGIMICICYEWLTCAQMLASSQINLPHLNESTLRNKVKWFTESVVVT